MQKLEQNFFARKTNLVSQELIGKVLHFHDKKLIITETESYIGIEDPACHASKGRTARTEVMFSDAGVFYVYFIYGMYYCLNVVTEVRDFPAAVLIRAALLCQGPDKYLSVLAKVPIDKHLLLDGPGKLCRYLAIDKSYNGLNILDDENIYFADYGINLRYLLTPRIGLKVGLDKLWRNVVDYRHYLSSSAS